MYWPARRNFPGLSWPLPPFSVAGRILPESSYVAPDSVVEMEVQSLEKSLAGSRRYGRSKEKAPFACPGGCLMFFQNSPASCRKNQLESN